MPEAWLTIEETCAALGISRREAYNRMRPGDAHFLVSKQASNRRLVSLSSMPFEAQLRWQEMTKDSGVGIQDSGSGRTGKPTVQTNAPNEANQAVRTTTALQSSPNSLSGHPPAKSEAQLSLLPKTEIDRRIAEVKMTLAPSQADVAIQRYRIIEPLLNGDFRRRGFETKTAYLRHVATAHGMHENSLWRMVKRYKDSGEALASLATDRPGPDPGEGSLLEAIDKVLESLDPHGVSARAFLKDCYLVQRLSIADCHRELSDYLAEKQRAWGVKAAYDIPSYAAVKRYLRSIPKAEQVFAREGAKAFDDRCGAYISRRPPEHSNDVWVTDQRLVNVRVRDQGERLGRIWMVNFLDVRSFKWLGCAFGPVLSSDMVMRAGVMAMARYGIPRAIHEDRGKEFNCTAFNGSFRKISGEKLFEEIEGVWQRLDVRVIAAIGRNPKSKTIERWHSEVDRLDAKLPGSVGRNPGERPDELLDLEAEHDRWKKSGEGRTRLLTIEQYVTHFYNWCEQTWNAEHRGNGKYLNGLTPNEAYMALAPVKGFRSIPLDQLDLLTSEHRRMQVARGGQINITLYGQKIEYQSDVLFNHQGEEVDVVISRGTLHRVTVFTLSGELICEARLKPLYEWLPDDREELKAQIRCNAALRRAVKRGVEAAAVLQNADRPGLPAAASAAKVAEIRSFGLPKAKPLAPRPTSSDLAREALEIEEAGS